jgi:catechol 2,3-dioxygenase-like lactoylglutathione lyase family enzyme
MSTKPRFGFALEYVKDIERAKRFYVDVLGLEIERKAPNFVQFHDFAIATDEPMNGRRELELYWVVDDAQTAFGSLPANVEVTLPLKSVPFGTVFGIKDPDGQTRYLVEFAKQRPSQSV